ncbi:MAG: glycosyltransferase family 4 protein [Candidatus Cloacimonetes bacterium]|nr:glycosyltransferase family 4 protein [Candidatus Cloacimonadota bacterium]
MKKLLIFGDGSIIHTKKWIDVFKGYYKLYLISFSKAEFTGVECHYLDVGTISTSGNNYKYLLQILKVRKLIMRIKPDIINAHFLTSYGFIIALLNLRMPVLLTLHGSDVLITPQKSLMYRLAAKYTLSKLDYYFSAATHISVILEKKYHVKSTKITTIQYGVDVKKITQMQSDIKDIGFISTRNFVQNSNISIIIKAFAQYVKKNPENKLYILGSGVQEKELHDLVESLEVKENIIFTGKLQHDELLKFLVRAKNYLSMTTSDGSSLSLLEAMAAKVIPIVSDIRANREVLQDAAYYSEISVENLFITMNKSCYVKEIIERNFNYVAQYADFEKNKNIIRDTFSKYVINN